MQGRVSWFEFGVVLITIMMNYEGLIDLIAFELKLLQLKEKLGSGNVRKMVTTHILGRRLAVEM